MLTIREIAKKQKVKAGELLETARLLGLPVTDVDSQVSDEAQRILKKVRSYRADQIERILRLARANSVVGARASGEASHPSNSFQNAAAFRRSDETFLRLREDLVQANNAIADLRNVVSHLQNDLKSKENLISDEVKSSRTMIEKLQQQITDLRKGIEESSADLRLRKEVMQRTESAIKKSQGMQSTPMLANVSRLTAKLEQSGFFFQGSLIHDCLDVLSCGKPLLLVGSAGNGKSTLARNLPLLFWDGNFSEDNSSTELLTSAEAQENWSPFHVLGGEWAVGSRIFFELGIFSQAIIRCIERDGKHWLFIDELNRADVDKALGGLLGTMGLLHEGASLPLPRFSSSLRIPKSFRMICAMNDSDERHLFPLSNAVLSRFEVVRVDPPEPTLEQTAVRKTMCQGFGTSGWSDHPQRLQDFHPRGRTGFPFTRHSGVSRSRNTNRSK